MDMEEGGTVLDCAIDIMGIMEITEIVGIMAIMEMGVEVATLLEHGPVERAKAILQARAAPVVAAPLVDEVIDGYPLHIPLDIHLKDYYVIFDSA